MEGTSRTGKEYLYYRYRHRMWYQAYRLLEDRERAEEIVHDVFLHLMAMEIPEDRITEEKMGACLLSMTKEASLAFLRKEEESRFSGGSAFSEEEDCESGTSPVNAS